VIIGIARDPVMLTCLRVTNVVASAKFFIEELGIFYYLYVDSLTYAFLCRIKFCDTPYCNLFEVNIIVIIIIGMKVLPFPISRQKGILKDLHVYVYIYTYIWYVCMYRYMHGEYFFLYSFFCIYAYKYIFISI
jgi:hypothetical protein